jgi:hypothetical protein
VSHRIGLPKTCAPRALGAKIAGELDLLDHSKDGQQGALADGMRVTGPE